MDVIFVNERFDNSPSGKMMYHLLSSINQFYNDNLALEVMKGMKENAYQCKWSGGIPPLGYDVNEDKKPRAKQLEQLGFVEKEEKKPMKTEETK